MERRASELSESAPRAAAEKDVAVEKNSTVPSSFVRRMAVPSQPGTVVHSKVRIRRREPAPGELGGDGHRIRGVGHDRRGPRVDGVGESESGLAHVDHGDTAVGADLLSCGHGGGETGVPGADDDDVVTAASDGVRVPGGGVDVES